MTGYGKAGCNFRNLNINIEIRSLNSKSLDLNIKLPGIFKEKENRIRTTISQLVERGKIDFLITIENSDAGSNTLINRGRMLQYYSELKDIAGPLNIEISENILAALLRMPEVLQTKEDAPTDEDWEIIEKGINDAIGLLIEYRMSEGRHLQDDIIKRLNIIERLLRETELPEENRIPIIKQRILKSLKAIAEGINIDDNRLEQELIFYLEKLDFTEERVRLQKHLQFFAETIHQSDTSGKKLGFIAQEIGREINTIGSKANDADIQKIVVQMKDELEKIKEQLMNVL